MAATRIIQPLIQMVWELSLGSFQHFKTPPVSVFLDILSIEFFPRNKHLFWNHSIIFYKCQNHWNPPQHFRFFPMLHLLPQLVPKVCQSSHSKTRSLHWFVSHHSFFPHHILNIKLLCFLLTLSRLFYWIGGHWYDGLFIASEKIFLLSSHLFCLLHILLNLHFVFDKSRNTSEIVLLGTGMPIAYILLFIIFLPLYFYLSTEFLEWRKRMLKGAD